MNLLLDMKTIIVSLVFGNLFTVLLICAYRRGQGKDYTVGVFFAAKCLQSAAWLIQALRGAAPDNLMIPLANTLMFAGAALEAVALLMLKEAFDRTARRLYIALTAACVAGFCLVMLLHNEENSRIVFASIGTAALIVAPAWRLLRERGVSALARLTGWMYVLAIVALVGRAEAAGLSGHAVGLFRPSVYQTFSFLSAYLIMILGNTGFILLSKERADKELARIAGTDELTGILNRRMFIQEAKRRLAEAAAAGKPISLLLFDMDRFKAINDTFGHGAGDMALQDMTARVRGQLEAGELFGRYGGDEFAVLLPDTDASRSEERAERIRRAAEGARVPGHAFAYTISVGVVTVAPGRDTQLETLYTACDKALYGAKDSGRNAVFRVEAI